MATTSQRFLQENRRRFTLTGLRFVAPPLASGLGRVGLFLVAGVAFRAKERWRAGHLPIPLKVAAQLVCRQPPRRIIQQKPVFCLKHRPFCAFKWLNWLLDLSDVNLRKPPR